MFNNATIAAAESNFNFNIDSHLKKVNVKINNSGANTLSFRLLANFSEISPPEDVAAGATSTVRVDVENIKSLTVGVNSPAGTSANISLEDEAISRTEKIDINVGEERIYVPEYATGGDGTASSPYTGWQSNVPWGSGRSFIFNGVCGHASPLNLGMVGSAPMQDSSFEGINGATILYTGTTNAKPLSIENTLYAGADALATIRSNWTQGLSFRNLTIDGNGNATNGLTLIGLVRSEFKNVRLRGAVTVGILIKECDLLSFDLLALTSSRDASIPVTGVQLNVGTNTITPTRINFNNPAIGGCTGTGILVTKGNAVKIEGGTIINCGVGISLQDIQNMIVGTVFKTNTTDLTIGAAQNETVGITANGATTVTAGAGNTLGGTFCSLVISAAVVQTRILRAFLKATGDATATYTDGGSGTRILASYDLTAAAAKVDA